VPRVVVESAHLDQLREHGGLPRIRDENALESALARAQHIWYDESTTDVCVLAAAYGYGLSKAHPFNDGNTRIAFVTMVVFLELNGASLAVSEAEVVTLMVGLAEGAVTEPALIGWLRARVTTR
jgi:death-on-curing protein